MKTLHWVLWSWAVGAAAPALAAGTTTSPATTTRTTSAQSTSSQAQQPVQAPAAAPLVQPAEQSPAQEEKAETEPEPPTLESRIPPVSGRSYLLGKKIEIMVGIGLSLNDAFLEKFMPELSAGYHLNDFIYIGVRGGYAFDVGAGHVSACSGPPPNATCGPPSSDQLNQLPGNITATIAAEFAWTPLYGKVNLFGEKVVHLDTSVVLDLGVAILGPQPNPSAPSVSPEFAPGLAETFFLTPSLALTAELRDMLYSSTGLQSQMMFHLGFVILL